MQIDLLLMISEFCFCVIFFLFRNQINNSVLPQKQKFEKKNQGLNN